MRGPAGILFWVLLGLLGFYLLLMLLKRLQPLFCLIYQSVHLVLIITIYTLHNWRYVKETFWGSLLLSVLILLYWVPAGAWHVYGYAIVTEARGRMKTGAMDVDIGANWEFVLDEGQIERVSPFVRRVGVEQVKLRDTDEFDRQEGCYASGRSNWQAERSDQE